MHFCYTILSMTMAQKEEKERDEGERERMNIEKNDESFFENKQNE